MLNAESGDGPFLRDGLVWRRVRLWSAGVQALLGHLHANGFEAAPRAAGVDQAWERVTFLDGKTGDIETDAEMQSAAVLASAARLLCRYHCCAAPVAVEWASRAWQSSPRAPFETICHGDFAPYNVVLRDGEVSGIIDFETAHPGPRIWDLAYAVYRWAPLSAGAGSPLAGIDRQVERARLFLDEYGLDERLRAGVVATIVARLERLVVFMQEQAANGSEKYRVDLAEGHDRVYRADIDYISLHRQRIAAGMMPA
jgi:aminoglycoside phosphotransferase (APT) family kinase protein